MADFVAVLRKTIGGLGDNTPAMREKVYEKARSTIEAKLAAINPPPPPAVVERQRKALEDAIAVVRADYADKKKEEDDGLEDVFASLKTIGDPKPDPAAPKPSAPPAIPPAPVPEKGSQPVTPKPSEPVEKKEPSPPVAPILTGSAPAVSAKASSSKAFDPVLDDEPSDTEDLPSTEKSSGEDNDDGMAAEHRTFEEPKPRRRMGGMIAALLLLLALAGGGYAVWMNKDELSRMAGLESGPGTGSEEVATTADDLSEADGNDGEASETPPASEETPAGGQADGEAQKFTQRLLPDGSEVDEGRADGEPSVGEGTSVATIAQPDSPPAETPDSQAGTETDTTEPGTAEETARPAEEPAGEADASEQQPAVAVGQRAIFYEERTSSAQGSADTGSIVWSLVEESPGGDLPAEPAIRAEATIPGKDVQLRMTIRRNGDDTLPASHIIEMIFLTPDTFEGGSISNVARISFKETEQATGNPLLGIPAKIADGFFLIALGNAPAEVEANMTLLRRQSWVDIPIVYQSGRRALLSLEKGIPGDRVFQEALRAWEEASG